MGKKYKSQIRHHQSDITNQTSYIKKSYSISPLGDSALFLSFGNMIDREANRKIVAIARHFSQHPFFGLISIVPAYSSITFCYNLYMIHQSLIEKTIIFDWVKQQVEQQLSVIHSSHDEAAEQIEIPVCYDAALSNDLETVSLAIGLTREEIIEVHSCGKYYVYMLGFLPGFAYMGEVDPRIEQPRKAIPAKVKAGSVAIAGRQTGIYPLDSFGGWHVLGHTPVTMFNPANAQLCHVKAGQEVKFCAISIDTYREMVSRL